MQSKRSSNPSDSHIAAVESFVALAEQYDMLWKQTDIMQVIRKN